jgi:hypothetical protein
MAECAPSGLSGSLWLPDYTRNLRPGQPPPSAGEWQYEVVSIPSGIWTFRWQSWSASSQSSSSLFVADVEFVPQPPPSWLDPIGQLAQGQFWLELHGAPGEVYDVEASQDLHHWSRLGRSTMSDFRGMYFDTNAPAAARFYRMNKATLSPTWFESPFLDASRMVQLTLHSEPQQPLLIQFSTNLMTWEDLIETNNPMGTLRFADAPAKSKSMFYRAKSLPWTKPIPAQPGRPLGNLRRHLFSFARFQPQLGGAAAPSSILTVPGRKRRLADAW